LQISHQVRRPTKHYDNKILSLDEQLCALIAQRKSVSNNNPGFPPIEQLSVWAQKYGLFESYLHSVFNTLYNEHLHRPKVEPTKFRGLIPVMKFVEADSQAFSITHLRQYENATVLYLQADGTVENETTTRRRPHLNWDLYISPEYECYSSRGSGNNEQWTQQFVISPRLPDDVKGITFKFWWRLMPPSEDSEDLGGEVIVK